MTDSASTYIPRWERPIRIPETVPLEHTAPEFAFAGQKSTWELPFRLSEEIEADAVLKLQIFGGRNNKGVFINPQVKRPEEDGYLTLRIDDGERLELQPDKDGGTFLLGERKDALPAGTVLTATLGDRTAGGGGIQAPAGRLLGKFFLLHREARPKGDSWAERKHGGTWGEDDQHLIVGACVMHILGGELDHLRAYVPSQTTPGQAFDILVRPEDEFSNLSHRKLSDLVATLDGKALSAELRPVPESTCLRARVCLPDEGVYRLTVRDTESGHEVTTNPTICRAETADGPQTHWGMIHGHTEMSDGTGTLENYFHQTKEEAALDFVAPGDHDHLHETSDRMWEKTCATVARWHAPGEFVTFLGYEWAKWRRNGDGDRNVYYLEDDRPLYRSDEGHCPSPPDLFEAIKDEKALVIPHHPGHRGNFCDYKDHDPIPERLVEIFQMRGSYECSEEDGNPVPERGSVPPMPEGYVSRALALGWRVGFTAGGDDHAGHAGTDRPRQKSSYNAGLMSVQSSARTREAIWDALWNRRVVATTGPRMLLTFDLDGNPMGSELSVATDPGLAERRTLNLEFHGTARASHVDIIRNNEVVHSFPSCGPDCELSWEDTTPLSETLLPPAKFCERPFCFYYARVVQEDEEVAWSSPIWID